MNVKMHSPYDHFPQHHYVEGEPYISMYNDIHVCTERLEPNAVALLLEPRTIQPNVLSYMEKNWKRFKYVYTHDSILLECIPNARLVLWGNVYMWADRPKTKGISFCSSEKEGCIQHVKRRELAFQLEKKIDCMGTYNGGERVWTEKIYSDYKFSVCIENFRDDWWFTEKICNAFSNKCVPIYYGARKINELFDERGIVVVDNLNDIPKAVDQILYDLDWEYDRRKEAIDINYEKVKAYDHFENWFFKHYEEELQEIWQSR